MTLAEIVEQFPDLFYLNNRGWWDKEQFMQHEPRHVSPFFHTSTVRLDEPVFPVQAVELAALYIKNPDASVWHKFLNTDDVDSYGNRVYVGGVGQHGIDTFQLHRHLAPACWWPMFA